MTEPAEDLSHTVTAFHEHARWTGVTDDNREEWLKQRHRLCTASQIPALLGLSPFEDAIDVYARMLTKPSNDVYMGLNDPRTWGKALEFGVANQAAKHYGWNLRMSGALLVSRAHPNIACTQDAEVEEVPGSGVWCSYEGKTTSAFRYRDWDEDTCKAPDHVIAQVQSQLLVTGAPKNIVSCLIGGQKFVRIDFYPDEEFFELIIFAVEDMMDRIKRMDPPPPTWRSERALKMLYPETDGSHLVLPRWCVEYTRELQELLPKKKELEQREKQLRLSIAHAMGKACVGVLLEDVDEHCQWTFNTISRAGYTVEPTSYRQLRLSKGNKKKGRKS
jgi:putative phage-type endonuclease